MPIVRHTKEHPATVTWFELYTLYRMMGNPPPPPTNRTQATPQPSLRQQLYTFRLGVRLLARLTMQKEEQKLFAGIQGVPRRLLAIGATTFTAHLPWAPSLTKAAMDQLTIELIRSQHGVSRKRATEHLRDGHKLPMARLRTGGRVHWAQQIQRVNAEAFLHNPPADVTSKVSTGPYLHQVVGGASADAACQDGHPDCLAFFRCPSCPHRLPATKPAFQRLELNRRIWCRQCGRMKLITRWQCACGQPWHLCPIHRTSTRLPATTTHNRPTTTASNTITKRAPPNHSQKRSLLRGRVDRTHQWLDQPPLKRAKPEPRDIELDTAALPNQVQLHLLGPKAKAKLEYFRSQAAAAQKHQLPSPQATTNQPPTKHTKLHHCKEPAAAQPASNEAAAPADSMEQEPHLKKPRPPQPRWQQPRRPNQGTPYPQGISQPGSSNDHLHQPSDHEARRPTPAVHGASAGHWWSPPQEAKPSQPAAPAAGSWPQSSPKAPLYR